MKLSAISNNILTKQFNAGHALCFRGMAGMAKTARIQQYAHEMGLGLVTEFLPAQDAPDAMGFLIPTRTDDGPVSTYSKPNWLRRIELEIEAGHDRGILFLNEYLSADHLVQKAYAPLFSEGVIGEWVLPEGWVTWLDGNRTTDRAGANSMLGHVGNRMCVLDVSPDLESWTTYANSINMHPMYIAFAQARPGVVFNDEPPKNPNEQRISPRSFTFCHDFHTDGDSDVELDIDSVTQSMVEGYIGFAASTDFFAFLKTADELPTIEEIIADPMGAKLPSSYRLDAQFAGIQLCVHHGDSDTIDPIFQWVCRLNKDMQASAAKQLIDKTKGSLLNSPALGKWIAENPALIQATFS